MKTAGEIDFSGLIDIHKTLYEIHFSDWKCIVKPIWQSNRIVDYDIIDISENTNLVHNSRLSNWLGVEGKELYFEICASVYVERAFFKEDFTLKSDDQSYYFTHTIERLSDLLLIANKNIGNKVISQQQKQKELELHEKAGIIAEIGNWSYDMIKNTLFWSKATKIIHGVDENYVPDVATAINFYKEGYSRNAITNAVNSCLSEGLAYDLILEIQRANGEYIWVNAKGAADYHNGAIVGMSGTFQNIDKYTKSEQERIEKEKLYQYLFKNNPNSVTRLNKEGKIIEFNDKLPKLLECEEDLIKSSKSYEQFVHPDDIANVYTKVSLVLQGEVQEYEAKIITPAGKIKLISLINIPIIINDTVDSFYSIAKDITYEREIVEKTNKTKKILAGFFNSTTELIAIFSEEKKLLAYNNVYRERYFSINKKEPKIGDYAFDFFGKPNADDFDVHLKLALKGQKTSYVDRFYFNNNYEWWNVKLIPIVDEQSETVSSIAFSALNITESRNAEQSAQEIGDLLAFTAKATGFGVWEYIYENNELIWDDNMYLIYDVERGEGNERYESWSKRVHPEDIDEANNRFLEAQKTGGLNMQFRVINRNGEIRHIKSVGKVRYIDNKPVSIAGINYDITKELLDEEEIRRLSFIAKETINGAIITDTEGKVVWVNRSFEKMSGYNLAELRGKKPGTLLQGKDSDPTTVKFMHEKIKERQPFNVEIINYDRVGNPYWVKINCQPFFDANNNLTAFFAIETDITKEKKHYFEKEKLISELTEHNADLTQFSYIVSHNLRAPITNLLALIDLFEPQTLTTENQEIYDAFKNSTYHINEILSDLVDLMFIKSGKNKHFELLNISSCFDYIKNLQSVQLNSENVHILQDFSEIDQIEFSKSSLESILLNLLTNSIKYRSAERDLYIHIYSKNQPDSVVLIFKDNGLGIDLELAKDKIFNMYQRFHNHVAGKGLGLYLIKTQMELHGGKIAVDSKVNFGTTFTLTFKKQ